MDQGLFARMLGLKYAIAQQSADADTLRAKGMVTAQNAAANLDTVKAGLMPAETKANIGLIGAQTGVANANAANIAETTKYVGPLARSSIGLNSAQANNMNAEAGFTGARTTSLNQNNQLLSIGDRFRLGLLYGN